MDGNITLYQLIYDTVAELIYCRAYPTGAYLPTIPDIAKQYGISVNPVQRAFSQLKEDGFISTGRGRPACICYENRTFLNNEAYRTRLLERRFAILEAYDVCILLFPQIAVFCAKLCLEKDIEHLSAILDEAADKNAPRDLQDMLSRFMACLIAVPQNHLLSEYAKDLIDKLRCARILQEDEKGSFAKARDIPHFLTRFLSLIENKRFDLLETFVRQNYKLSKHHFESYLSSLTDKPDITRCLPFQWRTKKDTLLYQSIINVLTLQIILGEYRSGDLLPSEGELIEIFHAARNTIRTVITLLNEVCAVKTMNGKGTVVTSAPPQGIKNPAIKKMAASSILPFTQAAQIAIITCKTVLAHTFPFLKEEVLFQIEMKVRALMNIPHCERLCSPVAVIFHEVVSRSPYHALTDLYELIGGKLFMLNHLQPYYAAKYPCHYRQLLACEEETISALIEKDAVKLGDIIHKFLLLMTTFTLQVWSNEAKVQAPPWWELFVRLEEEKQAGGEEKEVSL